MGNIERLNSFIPSFIHGEIYSNDICNFFNISRIRGDLPFLRRDDINVTIDFDK
jgi:hypothetical protein